MVWIRLVPAHPCLSTGSLTPDVRQILDTLSPELDIYRRCLGALRNVCGIYRLLPTSHRIPPGLTTEGKRPVTSGSYADVWKARSRDNQIFAVKHIRTYEVDDLKDVKKVLRLRYSSLIVISHRKSPQGYCEEVVICRRMRHGNILSVEGVAPKLFELCVISKWMPQGNVTLYVRDNEKADRMRPVSPPALPWCVDPSHPRCSVTWHHAGPRLSPLERGGSRKSERSEQCVQLSLVTIVYMSDFLAVQHPD